MTKPKRRKRPNPKINHIYLQLYDLDKRYMITYGSRRSGKSVYVSQALARRGLENPNRNIVIMRKFATTIRLSVWARMLDAIDEIVPLSECYVNKSDRIIQLPNGSSYNFVGADDAEKLKSIENVTDYWMEEATEFTEEDFDTIDAGMSTACDPPPQIWLSFNPIPIVPGYMLWIQERFLQIEHELGQLVIGDDYAVIRTYYRHNKYCPEATKKVLEKYRTTNPDLWKMWGLGEFATLHGAILKNWDVVKDVPTGIPMIGYGEDFGFADDPAAVVKVWRHRDDVWIQQKVYAAGLTNPELSEAMEYSGMRKGIDHTIADNAEPKTIQELKNLGWLMSPCEKGRDYKRAAALYLMGLKLHVLEDSPAVKKEFATWSWKLDKEGKPMPVVADGNDHCVDAFIYRIFRPSGTLSEDDLAGSTTEDYNPVIPEDIESGDVEPLFDEE